MISPTEKRNEKTKNIDRADTIDIVHLINEENERSVAAVGEAAESIAQAADAAAQAISHGGRLVYVGAGTSGRIAVSDAAECPPTFGVDYDTVIAVMAGGEAALVRPSEDAEDRYEDGIEDIKAKNLTSLDMVMGISASGNAPYVLGALDYARSLGCTTAALSSNPDGKMLSAVDIPIFTDTGAEVVTGSTRMKAGNAQKMVLNMISTAAMIKNGKVYENFMINLRPTNKKLRERMIRIVSEIASVSESEAEKRLSDNGFSIKEAIK